MYQTEWSSYEGEDGVGTQEGLLERSDLKDGSSDEKLRGGRIDYSSDLLWFDDQRGGVALFRQLVKSVIRGKSIKSVRRTSYLKKVAAVTVQIESGDYFELLTHLKNATDIRKLCLCFSKHHR